MTPQEIQIAVAEEMGWTNCEHVKTIGLVKGFLPPKGKTPHTRQYPSGHYELPDYTTSLDAIQQVCLERFDGINGIVEFQQQLGKIEREKNREKSTWSWQLTALDWCKAFLETVKQLEEVK